MDTEKFQNIDSPDAAKSREGMSRRKLLIAGAASVPVMVTIKSAGAQAAGMTATPATWGGGGHWWGGGGGGGHQPGGMLNSIACLQNMEMPWNCEGAVKDVCEKEKLDYSGWRRRKGKGKYYGSMNEGRVMPASYGGHHHNDQRVSEIWNYFYDRGRTHFWPGCEFNASKDRHCTYVQICMSTACWNSISTAINWSGGKGPL